MNKYLVVTIIISFFLFLGGALLFSRQTNSPSLPPLSQSDLPDHLVYFWGDGCPHCANVQAFFDSWENFEKAGIEKMETWNNKENNYRLQQVGAFCQIPKNQIGVPLLFTPEGKCISGDTPIIDHLKGLTF